MTSSVPGDPSLSVASWAGGGSILFVHATGFCKETWTPVVEDLQVVSGLGGAVAMDQRGHGDSAVSPPPYDWWDLGRDVLRVVDAVEPAAHVGVGHSSGAAALAMAEILRPGTFAALVLVEPIIFPGPYHRVDGHPLTASALKRRPSFPSPEKVHSNFAGKVPFSRWDPRALEAYVQGGFRPGPDGDWVLKCSPEVEAEFYRGATAHGAWERLDEIRSRVTLMAGERSDTHSEPFLSAQAERFRAVDVAVVPGASHFVPMEQPTEVATAVAAAA